LNSLGCPLHIYHSTNRADSTAYKNSSLLETQRGVATPLHWIGPVESGVCLAEEVQYMEAWQWENISAHTLELLICINRNSQLTISIIYLKLLYQILLSLLILFINMCIYIVLHLARQYKNFGWTDLDYVMHIRLWPM